MALEELNRLLLAIDEDASPLCSIAVVDRLGAYLQSQPILVGGLLLLLLFLGWRPLLSGPGAWRWTTFVAVTGVAVLAGVLWLSTERAIRYWGGTGRRWLLAPSRPRVVLDLFLVASSTRSRWASILWDNVWGPFWENVMFPLRSERQLVAAHEFRFDVARNLWRQLKRADVAAQAMSGADEVDEAITRQRVRALASRLWVVTGDPQFRRIEARASITREDLEISTAGIL